MKLYATTTSERASKGQGGNKKIEIALTADNPSRHEEYKIWYQKTEKGTHLCVYDIEKGYNVFVSSKEKGKQQKGEKCKYCDKTSLVGKTGLCGIHYREKILGLK